MQRGKIPTGVDRMLFFQSYLAYRFLFFFSEIWTRFIEPCFRNTKSHQTCHKAKINNKKQNKTIQCHDPKRSALKAHPLKNFHTFSW
jgi:hypothetical protein